MLGAAGGWLVGAALVAPARRLGAVSCWLRCEVVPLATSAPAAVTKLVGSWDVSGGFRELFRLIFLKYLLLAIYGIIRLI